MTFLHTNNILKNVKAQNFAKRLFVGLVFMLLVLGLNAQSPFSRFGFGGSIRPQCVGQTSTSSLGLGFRSTTMLNLNNPAALSELEWTTFEAGARIDNYMLSLGDNLWRSPSGRISVLALAVPIRVKNKKRWGSSFSLSPTDIIQYNFEQTIDSAAVRHVKYELGSGNSYAVNWSNGWLWNATSLGISCIYTFGTESNFQGIIVDDSLNARNSRRLSKLNHKGLRFNLGWQYSRPLGASKPDKIQPKITLGANFEFTARALNQILHQDELTLTSILTGQQVAVDTLNTEEVTSTRPSRGPGKLGLGFSIGDHRSWLVHGDYQYAWQEDYSHWLAGTEVYRNTHFVALGFRGTPNYSGRRFLGRIEYRIGGHWQQSPLIIDGYGFNTFGMAFGIALPMGNSMSRLNLSTLFQRRIGGGDGFYQEDWVSLVIGVNLNDKWFIKRKFN